MKSGVLHINKAGTDAVRRLRMRKLRNGLPFMINTRELPATECYLEYPDGKIKLVSMAGNANDFTEVRVLNEAETNRIRTQYNFPVLHG